MQEQGFYRQLETYLRGGKFWTAVVLSGPDAGSRAAWREETILYRDGGGEDFWRQVMAAGAQESTAGQAAGEPQSTAAQTGPLGSVPHSGHPAAGVLTIAGRSVYRECLVQEPEVVICGGGHISMELAQLADYMQYPYIILDDREEFCCRERFPGAKELLCGPFSENLQTHSFSADAYYIIVTRGHAADLECLRLILKKPAGYIGMIGSRGKVAKTMTALREEGYPEEALKKVHAPIGLAIGGQTPKEIAVSILAQLIQTKNSGDQAVCLDREFVKLLSAGEPGILVTVTGKRGSAPRGVGSRMIVGPDKITGGTIGGGMVEYEAEKKARELLAEAGGLPVLTETYLVNESSAAALGMWCGGEVDVCFERL